MSKQVSILGCNVDAVTMDEALERVDQFVEKGQPRHIVTINPEIIWSSDDDAQLRRAIRRADLVVPDGIGVVWASRYIGDPLPERVAGFDLMQGMLAMAAKKGYRVYLLGAAPGVANKAALKIMELYPGCNIVGVQDGFFKEEDEDQVVATIRQAAPDMLFCALGPPRPAEKWIQKHLDKLEVPVSMGVGGSFNVLAGVVKRAPKWVQKIGLEWLHRGLSDPKRFTKRFIVLPKFVIKVLREGKKR